MTDWCPYAEMITNNATYNERVLLITILIIIAIFLQYRQRDITAHAYKEHTAFIRAKREEHTAFVRAKRMQETRMRREREALKRERMAWDRDYKIMCERNRKR